MKKLAVLFLLALAAVLGSDRSFSQNVLGLPCVGAPGSTFCSDGSTLGLRGNTTTTNTYAVVAGHNSASDGGGGDFIKLGVASAHCNTYLSGVSGTGVVGTSTITGLSGADTGTLSVGELVTGSGTDGSGGTVYVPAGTEIASKTSSSVTLTLPLAGTSTSMSGGVINNITFTGDNGGTLIIDNEPGSGTGSGPQCWQKTTYRGDPHEWGAYGDAYATSPHDDTTALRDWLGAFGISPATMPTASFPSNFGPYNAFLPGTYQIKNPLICPPGATILGPANVTSGSVANGGPGSPPVEIVAANNFKDTAAEPGLPAVIIANAYCRLSGIAVDASNAGGGKFSPSGSVSGTTVTFPTGTSIPGFVVAGVPISDSGGCIAPLTTVTATSGSTLTISNSATGSCGSMGSGDTITITGFYAVEVLGTHVGIDGHSLLKGGYYNVNCGDVQLDGLQIKDSQFVQSVSDDIHMPSRCADVRLNGDLISGAGAGTNADPDARGVFFGGSDLTVADGIIEQSQGTGLDLESPRIVTVTGMTFDRNGKGTDGGPAILVNGGNTISICSNAMTGNGGTVANSSQIMFQGSSDGLSLCGNTYLVENIPGGNVTQRPSFVYGADSTTAVTNTSLYEHPAPQVTGIYSPQAKPAMAQLQVPHVPVGYINGLGLLSGGSMSTAVNVKAGEAADSTNSAILKNRSQCPVDLASTGVGGLDSGSTLSPNATYFYFVISGADGANPNCMASSSLTPNFLNTSYTTTVTGWLFTDGSTFYEANTLAGVLPGDLVTFTIGGTNYSTTVSSTGTLTIPPTGSTINATLTNGSSTITCLSCTGGMGNNMAISAGTDLPKGDTIANVAGLSSLTVTNAASFSGTSPKIEPIIVSGEQVITLAGVAPPATPTKVTLTVYTGLYRMVGALYTDGSSKVVQFTQDGDTFYLNKSVEDISATPSGGVLYSLSVPCGVGTSHCSSGGVQVEALGRIVGSSASNPVLLTSPDQSDQTPSIFTTAPGFSVQATATQNSFPFRVFTNQTGQIRLHGSGNTVNEVTDGWVLHRSLY